MFNWNNDKAPPPSPAAAQPAAPSAAAAPGEGAGQGNLSKDQIAATVSKLISAAIGEAVIVLSRSPMHKHFALADIEWMVLPPVLSGQAFIAEVTNKDNGTRVPVALITWARVSPEVDRKLTEGLGKPMRLRPDEWTSGDIVWIVDAIGDPRVVTGSLGGLLQGPLKEGDAKLVMREAGGQLKISSLREIVAAAQAQNAGQQSSQAGLR